LLPRIERYLLWTWLAIALLLGVFQALAARGSMNPDGIAYLDMGDAYLRGDWPTAIRSHWSPLYSWFLGVALRVVQPAPDAEFPLVHLVNLFIYCLTLGALAFTTFLLCTLEYTPLSLVTPDLLVSGLLYAICGVILRIQRRLAWQGATILGVLLGLGYLAKAPMLPIALVFLGTCAVLAGKRATQLAPAVVAMLAIVIPFVVVLSIANGRLTLGDSALLNYLWRIDGAPFVHWQGEPISIGVPVHHSTLLQARPSIFAFDSPFRVTYSAWYAPEYWFAGATPAFVLPAHLQAIQDALIVYARLVDALRCPLLGLAVLLALRPRFTRESLVFLVPASFACALYAMVLVEERYVAPFLVLFVLGALALLRLPRNGWRAALAGLVSVLVVVAVVLQADPDSLPTTDRLASSDDEQVNVALALRSAGIQPGDAVATGNRGFNAYWARLARVTLVAEVSGYDGTAVLESDARARAAAQQVLLAQPVRAVVAYSWPAQTADPGWRPVAGTGYFYYLVR
jgi:hypothetical protein